MVGHLLAGILLSSGSLLITLKQNQVPGCTCFRRQSMEAPTAALALRLDCSCRVRTSRRPDWANFRFWKRCFFVSLVLNGVHSTIVTCKLSFPSLLIHHFNDLLVHQREAVGRLANSPLHELLCVSQKVACL